jgi:heat shock protein HtpX
MSGTIDSYELMELRSQTIKLSRADKMMEILSTHPNMLKQVKHLASLMG